jgi:hypothetical protein
LIGESSCDVPTPVDSRLTAFDLVDVDAPLCVFVDEALVNGPGVRESRALLAVAQQAADRARLTCGPFHQAERRKAESKLHQAFWNDEDVRGKLTAGVTAAYSVVSAGRRRQELLDAQLRNAAETYSLSNARLLKNVPGNSIPEVAQALNALVAARRTHVEALSEYDKAQISLLVLLGRRVESPRMPVVAGPSLGLEAPRPETIPQLQ